MLHQSVMGLYRIIAIIIICTPMVVNVINKGEIIDSLVYLPLLTLLLTFFFIYLDKKLTCALSQLSKNTITLPRFQSSSPIKRIAKKVTSTRHCIFIH